VQATAPLGDMVSRILRGSPSFVNDVLTRRIREYSGGFGPFFKRLGRAIEERDEILREKWQSAVIFVVKRKKIVFLLPPDLLLL
jgi:hypothetical protein